MSNKVFRTVALVAGVVAAVATMGAALPGIMGVAGTMTLSIGGATIAASAIAAAASALSVGASLLGKPSSPKIGAANQDRLTLSINVRRSRVMAFGTTAFDTDLRDQEFTGADKEYLHRFVVCAAHKVSAYREIWFDDKLAWSAAGGVTSTYAGYLTVTPVQEGAPGNAINISSRMGSSRRFTGCAYVYFRFKLTGNSKKTESPFAQQVPTRITIIGDGIPCYDPRQDSTQPGGSGAHRANDQSTWTWGAHAQNLACQYGTRLLGWRIQNPQNGTWKLSVGAGTPPERIDWASFIEGANLCDEAVLKAGGGTERRYRGGGLVDEDDDPTSVTDAFKAAMNADVDDQDGLLRLTVFHNDLATPDADFTEADIVGDYVWLQTPALHESFNVVRGSYVEPASLYQPGAYRDASVESPDSIERVHPADFGLVQSRSQAERLAKQRLQRQLYGGEFRATFLASGWKVHKNSVIRLSFAPEGWVNKLFRVAETEVRHDGLVPMVLREEHPQIYAWDAEESPAVELAEPTAYLPGEAPIPQFLGTVEEGADVTGDHTALDTAHVGGLPADDLVEAVGDATDALSQLDSDIDAAQEQIDGLIETYGSTASAAASAALAQAAKDDAAGFSEAAEAHALVAKSAGAMLLPDRYVTGTEETFSSVPVAVGSPADLAAQASNAVSAGFGPVYEVSVSGAQDKRWAHVGVLPATPGKVYQLSAEIEIVAFSGAPVFFSWFRTMDAAFAHLSAVGVVGNTPITTTGVIQVPIGQRVSNTAAPGVSAWGAAVWLRGQVGVAANGGTATVRFRRLIARDVTGEVAAAAQASIATGAAVTATNKAAAASTSEDLVAGYVGTVIAQVGIATDQAGIATDQAAVAQTLFEQTASLAAGGVLKNASFGDFAATPGLPASWLLAAGPTPTRAPGQISPNAVRLVGPAGANGAQIYQAVGGAQQRCQQGQWWVPEAQVTLVSGSLSGAGVFFVVKDASGNQVDSGHIYFSTMPDSTGAVVGAGVAGQTYRFNRVVQITAADAFYFTVHPFAHDPNAGSIAAANALDFHLVNAHPASEAEIATKTALPAVQAKVSEHTDTLASVQGDILTLLGKWGVSIEIDDGDGKPNIVGLDLFGTGSTGLFRITNAIFQLISQTGRGLTYDPADGVFWVKGTAYSIMLGEAFGTDGDLMFWIGPNPASPAVVEKDDGVIWFTKAGRAWWGGAMSNTDFAQRLLAAAISNGGPFDGAFKPLSAPLRVFVGPGGYVDLTAPILGVSYGAGGMNVTYKWQYSADDGTYTDVSGASQTANLGAGSSGTNLPTVSGTKTGLTTGDPAWFRVVLQVNSFSGTGTRSIGSGSAPAMAQAY